MVYSSDLSLGFETRAAQNARGTPLVVQIIPALSPPPNGVGDYALALGRELKASFGIDSVFAVADLRSRDEIVDGFRVVGLKRRSAAALVRFLDQVWSAPHVDVRQSVLLQFSPYGFQENGFPFWLSEGIRRWKAGNAAKRSVFTVFHELYGFGPPWTRGFWVSPLQRIATRRLFLASTAAMTTVAKYERKLQSWNERSRTPITCLAVPSGVGEPAAVRPVAQRSRRICLFGIRAGANMPSHAARVLGSLVGPWGIEEIAIVGGFPETKRFEALGCRVTPYRALDAGQVSAILSDSVLGASWYSAARLGKSSVFAAYCAHGVPTVLLGRSHGIAADEDGLQRGREYFHESDLAGRWNADLLQGCASRAFDWYQDHRIADHARVIASHFAGSDNPL